MMVTEDAEGTVEYRKPSSEIRRRLSANLKRIRAARGYTQEDLAVLSRMHKNYISNIEQTAVNPTLASLEALATGLGCTEAELLTAQREWKDRP